MSSIKLLLIYIFSLFGVAPFLNYFTPGSHRILIWGMGTVVAGLILSNEINRLKNIPKEYWLYISLLFFPLLSIYNVVDFEGFFRYYQVLIANSILMIVIFLAIKSHKDFTRVIQALFVCTSCIVIFSYIQEGGNSYTSDSLERLEGITGNSNGTAAYARISILLGMCILNWTKNKIWKIIIIAAIIVFAYVIILTASRANFAILLFILFSYVYIKYFKRVNILNYIAVVGLFIFSVSTVAISYLDDFYLYERLTRNEGSSLQEIEENEARLILYKLAFEATLENPILGLGLNQFRNASDGMISHTDILDIASQLGLFAVFFYSRIYIRIWKKFRHLISKFKGNIIIKILFLLFFTEILFGLSNPNWFLQLNMVVLSLLISYQTISERHEKSMILKT